MPRYTVKGQGTKLIIDVNNPVNIANFIVTDLRVRRTNTEPNRVLIFEFSLDAKPYRITLNFSDETFHARDLLGNLKNQEKGLEDAARV